MIYSNSVGLRIRMMFLSFTFLILQSRGRAYVRRRRLDKKLERSDSIAPFEECIYGVPEIGSSSDLP